MRTLLLSLLIACSLLLSNVTAQTIIMEDGSSQTCTGAFYDPGHTSGYENNQHYYYTLCPDDIGLQSNVFFEVFDLAPGDFLCIYSGDTADGEIIGCFTGNDLFQTQITHNNACLTFEFFSDDTVTAGGWIATINCSPFCQSIEPTIFSSLPSIDSNNVIGACPGEEVQIEAGAIFGQNDQNYHQSVASSTYSWEIDENILTDQNINVVFDNSGIYPIYLSVTDTIGCSEETVVGFVQVSGSPEFNIQTSQNDTICYGDSIMMVANPIEFSYTSFIETNGGGVALPDGDGTSYETSFVIDNLGGDLVIDEASDLESICVDIEHSWMRDLEIKLVCPNGQSIVLHDHPGQTGEEVFLGIPDQSDENLEDPIPGTGWTYCWTDDANQGTWIEYANANLPATLPNNEPFNTVDPISDLIGCPVEGEWSLVVTDLWSIDNGVIFGWTLDFSDDIFEDSSTFSTSIEFMTWEEDTNLIGTGDSIWYSPTATGTYDITFSTTDASGCSFDTTFAYNVVVNQLISGVNADLIVDQDICDTTASSSIYVSAINLVEPYTVVWSTGETTDTITGLSPNTYYATITDGNGCVLVDSTIVEEPIVLSLSSEVTEIACSGGLGSIEVTVEGGVDPYTYIWTPNVSTTSLAENLAAGSYVVEIADVNGCMTTEEFTLEDGGSLTLDVAVENAACFGGTGSAEVFVAGGEAPYTYVWNPNVSDTNSVTDLLAGSYSVSVNDVNECNNEISFEVEEPTSLEVVFTAIADVTCNGNTDGSIDIIVDGGTAPYTYLWNDVNQSTTPLVADLGPGTYEVIIEDTNGCQLTQSFEIGEPDALTATLTTASPDCDGNLGSAEVTVTGGTGNYTYNWSANATNTNDSIASDLAAGEYFVTVTDEYACELVESFVLVNENCCIYQVTTDSIDCTTDTFCVSLQATYDVSNGIIAMNYCLAFDTAAMQPTGNAYLGEVVYNALGGSGNGEMIQLNTNVPGYVFSNISYDSNVPAGTFWQGSGNVVCVEFVLNEGVEMGTFALSACEVSEGYQTTEIEACVESNDLEIDVNRMVNAEVVFWNFDGINNSPEKPLIYDEFNPSDYLITEISNNSSNVTTHTDLEGSFSWNINDGYHVNITRDIQGTYGDLPTDCEDIFLFVNGADAYEAALIANFDLINLNTGDSNWIPNAYQMIAADVNMNDKVRANDVTLILDRSVRNICEYPQVWNYTEGTIDNPMPNPSLGPSLDWRFIDSDFLNSSPSMVSEVIAEWTFENIINAIPVLPIEASTTTSIVDAAMVDMMNGNNAGSPASCEGNETWATNFWPADSLAIDTEYIDFNIDVNSSVTISDINFIMTLSSMNAANYVDAAFIVNGIQTDLASYQPTDSCVEYSVPVGVSVNENDVVSFRLYPYAQNPSTAAATLKLDNVRVIGEYSTNGGGNNVSAGYSPDPAYPVYFDNNATEGYWRDNVPDVPDSLELADDSEECPELADKIFNGVLLGDINHSWNDTSGVLVRTTAAANISFVGEPLGDGMYRIHVSQQNDAISTSVDFQMDYDETKMEVMSVSATSAAEESGLQMSYNNFENTKLYLSSYTMSGLSSSDVIYTIDVYAVDGVLTPQDLGSIIGLVNGQIVSTDVTIQDLTTGTETVNNEGFVKVSPNPNFGIFNLELGLTTTEDIQVNIFNMLGEKVTSYNLVNKQSYAKQMIDLRSEGAGVYNVHVSSGNQDFVQKVIVK